MKGVERLFNGAPRWAVQNERISREGQCRWFTEEKFYDPVEAFRWMLTEAQGAGKRQVIDRKTGLQVLWPHHGFTIPPLRKWKHVGIDFGSQDSFGVAIVEGAAVRMAQQIDNRILRTIVDEMAVA